MSKWLRLVASLLDLTPIKIIFIQKFNKNLGLILGLECLREQWLFDGVEWSEGEKYKPTGFCKYI